MILKSSMYVDNYDIYKSCLVHNSMYLWKRLLVSNTAHIVHKHAFL